MRHFALILCLALAPLAPYAAQADCAAEIDALYDGPLDVWQRPAYRAERIISDANGNVTAIWDDVTQTPLRGTTGIRGQGEVTLVIDQNYWMGPTVDGPWTGQSGQFSDDRREGITASQAARRAGVQEPQCMGLTQVDGRNLLTYGFVIETASLPGEPEGKSRDRNLVYIDPVTNLWMRWDVWEMTSPWLPNDTGERQVTRFAYDPTISISAPLAVQADPCREAIAGLFFGGALDASIRPPYRETVTTLSPDGTVLMTYEVTAEAVDKMMTVANGMATLMLGEESWIKASSDTPWALSPPSQPFDAVARYQVQRTQMAANLSETSCDGMYEFDGRRAERFTYRTRTDTDQDGIYFGALYSAYVDPETGLLALLESSQMVAHYAPEPSPNRSVSVYIYDPTIRLDRP